MTRDARQGVPPFLPIRDIRFPTRTESGQRVRDRPLIVHVHVPFRSLPDARAVPRIAAVRGAECTLRVWVSSCALRARAARRRRAERGMPRRAADRP